MNGKKELESCLNEKWADLKAASEERTKKLNHQEALQRLLFDVDNAEQWITERELIAETPIKVMIFT